MPGVKTESAERHFYFYFAKGFDLKRRDNALASVLDATVMSQQMTAHLRYSIFTLYYYCFVCCISSGVFYMFFNQNDPHCFWHTSHKYSFII